MVSGVRARSKAVLIVVRTVPKPVKLLPVFDMDGMASNGERNATREGINKSSNDNVLCSGKIDHSRQAKYCCICAQHSIFREAVSSADNLPTRI